MRSLAVVAGSLLIGGCFSDRPTEFHTKIRMERTGEDVTGTAPSQITTTGTAAEFDTNRLQGVGFGAGGVGTSEDTSSTTTTPTPGSTRSTGTSGSATSGTSSSASPGASGTRAVGSGTASSSSSSGTGSSSSSPGSGSSSSGLNRSSGALVSTNTPGSLPVLTNRLGQPSPSVFTNSFSPTP